MDDFFYNSFKLKSKTLYNVNHFLPIACNHKTCFDAKMSTIRCHCLIFLLFYFSDIQTTKTRTHFVICNKTIHIFIFAAGYISHIKRSKRMLIDKHFFRMKWWANIQLYHFAPLAFHIRIIFTQEAPREYDLSVSTNKSRRDSCIFFKQVSL